MDKKSKQYIIKILSRRIMSLFYILLFVTINLFFYTNSLNLFSRHEDKCNCIPILNSSNKSNASNIKRAPSQIIISYTTEEKENHLPANVCSRTPSLYNELTINNFVNFKSGKTSQFVGLLCLNCATCLAVAEIFELHVSTTLQNYFNKYSNEEIDIKEIQFSLTQLCSSAFKNYDLRNYDGHILVNQCSITTTHIRTPYDGQWTKKLRETCKRFLSHMDLQEIVFHRKWGNLTFANYLCSGDGIFRDCKNFLVYPEQISTGRGYSSKQLVDCNSASGKSQC